MSLLLSLLFLESASVAVPIQFNHQGRLLDADGLGLNGEHELSFILFDDDETGNVLCWGLDSYEQTSPS